jgi:hypothetical protein
MWLVGWWGWGWCWPCGSGFLSSAVVVRLGLLEGDDGGSGVCDIVNLLMSLATKKA